DGAVDVGPGVQVGGTGEFTVLASPLPWPPAAIWAVAAAVGKAGPSCAQATLNRSAINAMPQRRANLELNQGAVLAFAICSFTRPLERQQWAWSTSTGGLYERA